MAITSQAKFDQGRIFGTTFRVIGRNIGLWLGLAVIFSALPTVILEYLILERLAAAVPAGSNLPYLGGFAGGVMSLVLSSLLSSSLVRATIEDLNGKRPTMRDCVRTAITVLLPALGVGLLVGLGAGLGLILLIVPGIILWLRWSVAIPVLVQERPGVTASMARSTELTSGFRWPLFGLFLLLFIASIAIQWAVGKVEPLLGLWPGLFVTALIDSVTSMVTSTATAVSYIELRRIKEGTSVDELAEIFS